MREFNLRGLSDKRLWDTIWGNYEFENEQSSKYEQERSIVLEKHNNKLMEFVTKCLQKNMGIGELLIPAICSIRAEMDIPFDQNRYRKLFEKAQTEADKTFREFKEHLKSHNFS